MYRSQAVPTFCLNHASNNMIGVEVPVVDMVIIVAPGSDALIRNGSNPMNNNVVAVRGIKCDNISASNSVPFVMRDIEYIRKSSGKASCWTLYRLLFLRNGRSYLNLFTRL